MGKSVAVIICAAGASNRFGGKRKKQFVDVAGRAPFIRSIEFFSNHDDVKQILLAIPPEDEEIVNVKWGANLQFFNVKVCFGGDERFDTVKKAMELVKDDIDLIAVHDAVRCCVTKKWIDECFDAAAKSGAAILACPVVPTIKEVKDKTIIKTIDRSGLYDAQTPQVFKSELLKKAYANLDNLDKSKISDDADSSNIKITKAGDIAIAETIIKGRPRPVPKGPAGPYVEAQW
jgi:2-C-methyl-D-erythritol 4-phosphate cytidylyltransferase